MDGRVGPLLVEGAVQGISTALQIENGSGIWTSLRDKQTPRNSLPLFLSWKNCILYNLSQA